MKETICFGCMEKYRGYNICPYCGYDQNSKVKESYYLEPGNILKAKYLVGRVLGYGGFGITYLGMDLSLNRKVAIKEYLPSDCATRTLGETEVVPHDGDGKIQYEAQLSRFIDEAKALAKFDKEKGIVNVFDFFLENNTGYIVMEYMSCPTLKDILKERHRLPYEEAVEIITQVLETLQIVHAAGIIHRDVAPDNIFLTEKGEAKLTDFGAARYVSVAHSRSLSVILKPGYAPIEQYSSKGEQSSWTDVYASAATLYRMITGKCPPDAPKRQLSLKNDKKDILVRPSDLGIDIPKGLENALINGLHVQREDRYKTADEFLAALKSEKEKEKPVTISDGNDKRYKAAKILAAVLSIVVIGIGAWITCYVIGKIKIKPPVPPDRVYLQEVVGKSYDEAEKILEDCTLVIVGKRYSNSIPYNCIVEQIPHAGTILKKGSQVELIMSGGVQEINMPSLIAMTEEEAIETANAYGLDIKEEKIIREYNDLVEKGRVSEQSVSDGLRIDPKKTELSINVSLGKLEEETAVLLVPKLIWKTREEAEQILLEQKKEEGFTYPIGEVITKNSRNIPKGQIISQNPIAGTWKRTNEAIELVISDGPKTVIMPDVVYLTSKEAEEKLNELGLKTDISLEYSPSVIKGSIISQSVEAGQEIEEGSTVEIWVSIGVEMVSVPNLVGAQELSAIKRLEKNGLKAMTKREKSDEQNTGKVIKQSEKSYTEVPKGSTVILTIGSGPGD